MSKLERLNAVEGLGATADDLPFRQDSCVDTFWKEVLRGCREKITRPNCVEFSLSLGEPAFRAIVNVVPDDSKQSQRASFCAAMSRALDLPPRLTGLLRTWLSDRQRETYFGVARTRDSLRRKIYMNSRGVSGISWERLLRGMGTGFSAGWTFPQEIAPRIFMVAVDFEGSGAAAFKCYGRLNARQAGERFPSSSLLAFLETSGARCERLQMIDSMRFDVSGHLLDQSLHAEVRNLPETDWGVDYARWSGAVLEAHWLSLSRKSAKPRAFVLSESIGSNQGRHVYFGVGRQEIQS